MAHKHRFVIYGSMPAPEAALISRCDCGLEKFRGYRNGERVEQIHVNGEWRDYDGGWLRDYARD